MLTAFRYRDRYTVKQKSVLDWNDTMVYSSTIQDELNFFFYFFNHEDFTKLTMFKYPRHVL